MKCRLVLLRENSVEIADKADISCVLCQKEHTHNFNTIEWQNHTFENTQ